MYKLTIEVATITDLIAVAQKLGGQATTGKIEVPPVMEPAEETVTTEAINDAPAPKAKRASKKKADVHTIPAGLASSPETEEEMEDVPSPYTAPSAPVNTIDRTAVIARATELVAKLKASGVADADVMPKAHQAYEAAGCDKALRISQLDDASLARFMPEFEKVVASILTPVSFI